MALAKFVAVAAPGHIAEVGAVVADDVDVGACAADQSGELTGGVNLIAVVFLNEDVAQQVRIGRP